MKLLIDSNNKLLHDVSNVNLCKLSVSALDNYW